MTQLVELPVHLWTREDYYTMADAGLFKQQRVELLEGQVIEMSPMGTGHAVGIAQANQAIVPLVVGLVHVRVQLPLALNDRSELEPDIAIVAGSPRDYAQQHPSQALLLIEVAETSLAYDRGDKASAYARAGIADYWIVNLLDNQLEVYRDPAAVPAQRLGYAYATRLVLRAGDVVTPLMQSQATIAVADLLP